MSDHGYRGILGLSGHTTVRRARHLKKAAAYFAKDSCLIMPSLVSSRWDTQVSAFGWPNRKANGLISLVTRGDEPGRTQPSAN